MCDEGRYGYKHLHDVGRLTQPMVRDADGVAAPTDWSNLTDRLDDVLRAAGSLAAILSPHLTVEEACLLATYIRGLDSKAVLAVGPIPHEGDDEKFAGGFTIRAEKCPNRRGVEAIATALNGQLVEFEDFLVSLTDRDIQGVWVSGGYKTDWITNEQAEALASISWIVLQEMFLSPLSEAAAYRLGSPAFAEREGSYVNANDQLQSFGWAIRPPAGVMRDGQLYSRLLGRSVMYRASEVLDEVSRSIPYFEAAVGEIPNVGVDLKGTFSAGAQRLGREV